MSKQRTIDVHAHFLPPAYREALQSAGLRTLDGGMPVAKWDPERALAITDELEIAGAVLSVSSPRENFINSIGAAAHCRAINEYGAELKCLHPDRFGACTIFPTARRVEQHP